MSDAGRCTLTTQLHDNHPFLADFDDDGTPPLLPDEPAPPGDATAPSTISGSLVQGAPVASLTDLTAKLVAALECAPR